MIIVKVAVKGLWLGRLLDWFFADLRLFFFFLIIRTDRNKNLFHFQVIKVTHRKVENITMQVVKLYKRDSRKYFLLHLSFKLDEKEVAFYFFSDAIKLMQLLFNSHKLETIFTNYQHKFPPFLELSRKSFAEIPLILKTRLSAILRFFLLIFSSFLTAHSFSLLSMM